MTDRLLHLTTYEDRSGAYRWRLTAPNGRVVAAASEGFSRRAGALRNYHRLRAHFAAEAAAFSRAGTPEASSPEAPIPYPVSVWFCDFSRCYAAEVPDLPGCLAHGDTVEEAYGAARLAARAWIEHARAAGREVPEASGHLTTPGAAPEASGDDA